MADKQEKISDNSENPPKVAGVTESLTMTNLPRAPRLDDAQNLPAYNESEAKFLNGDEISDEDANAIDKGDAKLKADTLKALGEAETEEDLPEVTKKINSAQEKLKEILAKGLNKPPEVKNLTAENMGDNVDEVMKRRQGIKQQNINTLAKQEEISTAETEKSIEGVNNPGVNTEERTQKFTQLKTSLETQIGNLWSKNPTEWTQADINNMLQIQSEMNQLTGYTTEHYAIRELRQLIEENPNFPNKNLTFNPESKLEENTTYEYPDPYAASMLITQLITTNQKITQAQYKALRDSLRKINMHNANHLDSLRKLSSLPEID
jgi:hypothetical protein